MNDNFYLINDKLKTTEPADFKKEVENLLEWHRQTKDSYKNQKMAGALLDQIISKDQNLANRLYGLESLESVAGKVSDELRRLIDICYDKNENLRLRWACADILEKYNKRLFENILHRKELFNRNVDPDNPIDELDIEKAISEIAEKQKNEMGYYILAGFLIFAGIMGTFLVRNTAFLKIAIGCWIICGISAGLLLWIIPRRCPECRKFFARGALESVDQFNGPSTPIGSLGMGASPVHTRHRVTVYKTTCKHCQHQWIILR